MPTQGRTSSWFGTPGAEHPGRQSPSAHELWPEVRSGQNLVPIALEASLDPKLHGKPCVETDSSGPLDLAIQLELGKKG
jgi:hypothetical protein